MMETVSTRWAVADLITHIPPVYGGHRQEFIPEYKAFPSLPQSHHAGPVAFTDQNGVVLAWSLPGVILPSHRETVLSAAQQLFAGNEVSPADEFENGDRMFNKSDNCIVNPGIHSVSLTGLVCPSHLPASCQSILTVNFEILVPETKEFLSSLGDKHCVLDAALTAIISPHLWRTFPNVVSLSEKNGLLPWGERFVEDFNKWPFSGFGAGLWANLQLWPSRWFWNGPMGMALMMMVGTCAEDTKLVLHELRTSVRFGPGSVVAVTAAAIPCSLGQVDGETFVISQAEGEYHHRKAGLCNQPVYSTHVESEHLPYGSPDIEVQEYSMMPSVYITGL